MRGSTAKKSALTLRCHTYLKTRQMAILGREVAWAIVAVVSLVQGDILHLHKLKQPTKAGFLTESSSKMKEGPAVVLGVELRLCL